MRLAVYGTVSTLAASGVILSAFAQRANFYSATVYLAQSNACLMILTNFALLCALIFAHILQRILYGPLRDLEVESLYEKAWYAVTETCLAMTIFRDDWNVGFVVCFAGLLFAKGFCWLSAGRVEMMEQTPPVNPRLFHTRLVTSLLLLIASDIAMVYYAVSDILEAGKPGMMVMFAFEFTILLIAALSTAGRYILIMAEKFIVRKQAAARRAVRQAERATAGGQAVEREQQLADDEDEEEIDLVWEEKGTWMFYLELGTDFLKLLTYLAFFFIVLTFYGLPLHIIRDVYMTLRSFISRIRDFIRYRRATNDMNARYPDATAEEVERENVCIICREEMRPYIAPENQGVQGEQGAAQTQQRQRMRPKKLPCGHILHFACLRSWLERQQRCPTCRRPVLEANQPQGNQNALQQPGAAQQPGIRRNGIVWGGQIGGIRINFRLGQGPDFMQNLVNQWENRPAQAGNPAPGGLPPQPGQQNQQGVSQGASAQPTATTNQTASLLDPALHLQSGQSGLTNLRTLHLQLLDLERRMRRELEAVESASRAVGDVRGVRARIVQLRQGQSALSSNGSHIDNGTTTTSPLPQSGTPSPAGPASQQDLPHELQDLRIPPGWQVISLTPVGVNTVTNASSENVASTTPSGTSGVGTSTSSSWRSSHSPIQYPPSVGAFPTTLADLRRRRFGRGDVRNYNSTLRDYHAARSPGVERGESDGGLQASNTLTPSNGPSVTSDEPTHPALVSGNNDGRTNELEQRVRDVFQDILALDESTALLNSAARELDSAPRHANLLTGFRNDPAIFSAEAVQQAEREVGDAFRNRRAVIGLVERMLTESRQALGDRRSEIEYGGETIDQSEAQETSGSSRVGNEPTADNPTPTIPSEPAVSNFTPNESSNSSSADSSHSYSQTSNIIPRIWDANEISLGAEGSSTGDKGKAKAVTVESEEET